MEPPSMSVKVPCSVARKTFNRLQPMQSGLDLAQICSSHQNYFARGFLFGDLFLSLVGLPMPVVWLPASAAPATAPFAAPASAPTTTSRTTFVALLIIPFDEPDLRDFLLELFLRAAEDSPFLVEDFFFVALLVGMILLC